ncbi:hypothetical protein NITLEN_40212 [Nitrospira lenta]|uniref:Uncharacterized protein n=1 Tax=Nitrospira lenta TaxID=1436998 RepID=A0A330L904_9BACT|nr:hypothetical protein NITLEN_40212 [Nitrospira lenta]
MAPGLRYVNGELTRGFFFLRGCCGPVRQVSLYLAECATAGLQMKKTGVYKR